MPSGFSLNLASFSRDANYIISIWNCISCSYLAVSGLSCPNPSAPDNGYISDPYDGEGDDIKYACYDGYRLTGQSENYCLGTDSSPYWSFSTPRCEGNTHDIGTYLNIYRS